MLAPCNKHVKHREHTQETKGERDKGVNTSLHDSMRQAITEAGTSPPGKAQRAHRRGGLGEQGPGGGRCCVSAGKGADYTKQKEEPMRTQRPDRSRQGDDGRRSEPWPSAPTEGSEAEEADKSRPQRTFQATRER